MAFAPSDCAPFAESRPAAGDHSIRKFGSLTAPASSVGVCLRRLCSGYAGWRRYGVGESHGIGHRSVAPRRRDRRAASSGPTRLSSVRFVSQSRSIASGDDHNVGQPELADWIRPCSDRVAIAMRRGMYSSGWVFLSGCHGRLCRRSRDSLDANESRHDLRKVAARRQLYCSRTWLTCRRQGPRDLAPVRLRHLPDLRIPRHVSTPRAMTHQKTLIIGAGPLVQRLPASSGTTRLSQPCTCETSRPPSRGCWRSIGRQANSVLARGL